MPALKPLPRGAVLSEQAKAFGLSAVGHQLRLTPTRTTATANLSAKTRDKIAACHALGFTYWADHPHNGTVWATDTDQRFHAVRIHATTGKAEHSCTEEFPETAHCRTQLGHLVAISAGTGTREAVALLLGSDTVPDPQPFPEPANPNRDYGTARADDLAASEAKGPLGYCSSGRHDRCTHSPGGQFHRKGMPLGDGTRYHCPCECHRDGFVLPALTAAERKIVKARNARITAERDAEMDRRLQEMTDQIRAEHDARDTAASTPKPAPAVSPAPAAASVALGIIARTPSAIPNLHTDYLLAALGHTDHDEAVTAELHRRGVHTEAAS